MRKAVTVLAAALLASCASQQKITPSGASASAAPRGSEVTAVVDPSTLDGEQVRLLQRALVDRGFAIDMTGSFDPPTRTALAQFQRARGLPATANLNGPTMDALGLDPHDLRRPVGTAGTETQQSSPAGTGSGYGATGTGSGEGPTGTGTGSAPPPAGGAARGGGTGNGAPSDAQTPRSR